RLQVPVFDADGGCSKLSAVRLPPPLHLLPSFAAYSHLSVSERLSVARGIAAVRRVRRDERDGFDTVTFDEWLRSHGQPDSVIRSFWDLIVVPALNCRSDQASAAQALFLFQEGFLASPESAAIGVPTAGLSGLHAE